VASTIAPRSASAGGLADALDNPAGHTGGAATSAVLFAIHKHLQAKCVKPNEAFMACKKKDQDPAACLELGAKCTGCMIDVMKELSEKCPTSLNKYAECLDYRTNKFIKCREEQAEFEKQCPL